MLRAAAAAAIDRELYDAVERLDVALVGVWIVDRDRVPINTTESPLADRHGSEKSWRRIHPSNRLNGATGMWLDFLKRLGACRRRMPSADLKATSRRVSPRPFRCYPLIRRGPRRSPSACAEKVATVGSVPEWGHRSLVWLWASAFGAMLLSRARMPTISQFGQSILSPAANHLSDLQPVGTVVVMQMWLLAPCWSNIQEFPMSPEPIVARPSSTTL